MLTKRLAREICCPNITQAGQVPGVQVEPWAGAGILSRMPVNTLLPTGTSTVRPLAEAWGDHEALKFSKRSTPLQPGSGFFLSLCNVEGLCGDSALCP